MSAVTSYRIRKVPSDQGQSCEPEPISQFPLLDPITSPTELRHLPESSLVPLAAELRQFLIHSVAGSGGHFAAGLGTVELTIALHYVFNTPHDRLVWDVGHQTYPHKIITGRKDRIHTIRKKGGLSGFPKRIESPYDAFGVAHAGTSISAALGMAMAAKREKDGRRVVCVIGDGAMSAGMAFEALDHAGDLSADMLVILNDNNMSISPSVGALANHLARLLTGSVFSSLRGGGHQVLQHFPQIETLAHLAKAQVKGMVTPSTLFENLGFKYIGPVDGHDLPGLVKILRNLYSEPGPRFLHVVTRKGKGYAPAESDPVAYHSVPPFNRHRGLSDPKKAPRPTYTAVFSDWLCDMAEQDPRLIGITPAMREGSGLVEFCKRFPERYFDVGIAEQHAVTLAAGFACEGFKPVVAIYSTFLQRAYDQLVHDVAIQNLPVLFAIDRAGIVGPDGATHAGSFDVSYLRCIPNLVMMAPADENECRNMLYTGFSLQQPAAVRYPRASGPGVAIDRHMRALPVGKAELRRRGHQTVFLAFGAMVTEAMLAAEELDASVVNMRFIKPLDESLIEEMAAGHSLLVTVEDNAIAGGAGSAVNEYLTARGIQTTVINLGLPDRFLDHGARGELLADCGLDARGIVQSVRGHLRRSRQAGPAVTRR